MAIRYSLTLSLVCKAQSIGIGMVAKQISVKILKAVFIAAKALTRSREKHLAVLKASLSQWALTGSQKASSDIQLSII